MCKTYCNNCNDSLTEDEVRYAFEDPYCEDCFSERFSYCDRCDTLMNHSDAHYDSEGTPFCVECWESDFDENCPDNPDVDDADRKLIIELSRNFLLGKSTKRSVIKINPNDFMLSRIKEKVGLVDNPVYLFGLKDREEYQISTSSNLIDSVKEYILLNGFDWEVTEGIGCNRMGISYTLRKDNLGTVLKLIKNITRIRETVPA